MTKHLKYLLFYCSIIVSNLLISQELVPNSGFEEYVVCPETYTMLNQKIDIPHWYSPTKATPDYFNACSKLNVNVPVNFMGQVWAKEGNGYIGLLLTEHPDKTSSKKRTENYREYIQVRLQAPLKKDRIYRVSFYYCPAPYSKYVINNLGACLLVSKQSKRRFPILTCSSQYVGIDTAIAFLAYIGDGQRFSNGRQVANYVGMTPKVYSSGETVRVGHISKRGCKALRSIIVQSAWGAIHCKRSNVFKTKYEEL